MKNTRGAVGFIVVAGAVAAGIAQVPPFPRWTTCEYQCFGEDPVVLGVCFIGTDCCFAVRCSDGFVDNAGCCDPLNDEECALGLDCTVDPCEPWAECESTK